MNGKQLQTCLMRLRSRAPLIGGWLRRRARERLLRLSDPDALDGLCRTWIENDDRLLAEIATAAGHAPRDAQQRALFFFLTEQWERYESLDFDQSLLKSAYQSAPEALRRRVTEKGRQAGRADWIQAVVVGGRQGLRLGEMTDKEWEAVVAVLETGGHWDQMWTLTKVTPLRWSHRLLETLRESRWAPKGEEAGGFRELIDLSGHCTEEGTEVERFADLLETHETLRSVLPKAITTDGIVAGSVPRGHTITVAEGTVLLWRLPAEEPIARLVGHVGFAYCVAITPDGEVLASGGQDNTVRLWHLPDGQPIATLKRHTRAVICLAISPGGRVLASGSHDGTVRFWRLPDGTPIGRLKKPNIESRACLAFSPDGQIASNSFWPDRNWGGSSGHCVRLWRDGKPIRALRGHTGTVRCLAITPDGEVLVSGSEDNTVRLWRLPDGEPLGTLIGHTTDVNVVTITSDGRLIATGSGTVGDTLRLGRLKGGDAIDNTVRLWRLPDGKPMGILKGHTEQVECLAITPDGRAIMSGAPREVRMWGPPQLLLSPVGQGTVSSLQWVESQLRRNDLSTTSRPWLELFAALLRWNRRFDIEIGEAPRHIRAGEFDIEIERG